MPIAKPSASSRVVASSTVLPTTFGTGLSSDPPPPIKANATNPTMASAATTATAMTALRLDLGGSSTR